MLFRLVYDECLAQASYLIGCPDAGVAIVVDPARDVDRYVELADAHDVEIVAVAETHVHADFVSGARELAEAVGAHVYLSGHANEWTARWLDKKTSGGSYPHTLVRDADTIEVGAVRLRVMHTPGHTGEHLSFEVSDRGEPVGVLSGDFVFVGDVGRPDLLESAVGESGAAAAAARDLRASALRFRELPDHLQLWPGHGAGSACGKSLGDLPQSTIGYERRTNAPIRSAEDEEAFEQLVLAGQPEPPVYFARMKRLNRNGPPVLGGLLRPEPADPEALDGFDGVVVDCREWGRFRDGHLPGSLNIPIDDIFSTVAGCFIEPDSGIALIADETTADAAVRGLVRVGLDDIRLRVEPGDFEGWLGDRGATLGEDNSEAVSASLGGNGAILDIRLASEHAEAHLPGSVNIAYQRLADEMDGIPDAEPLYLTCRSGRRSSRVAAYLAARGIRAINHAGGIRDWTSRGLPVD